jgi:CheY-like chemotaxis protein
VILGKNGLDGLHKLEEYYYRNNSLPELILVDYQLPMMNGFEIIKNIKQHSGYNEKETKIILLTAGLGERDFRRDRKPLY